MPENMPEAKGRTIAAWTKITQRIREMIEKYPDDNIASHMVRLRELEFGRARPNAFYLKRELVKEFGQNILGTLDQTLDSPLYYPDVQAGVYRAAPVNPMTYLLRNVSRKVTDIVEFGSGWGANLFQLYVGLGSTRCRNISFHGAEYTDVGQEAANTLARTDPHLDLRSYSFDYRSPDLDPIDFRGDHVFALTRHSVEQVDLIDPALYDQLASLGKRVTLIHLEPVGWQRNPDLAERRAANDHEFFLKIGESISDNISTVDQQRANAAWWSWRLNYNTNLTSIIDEAERSGQVRKILEALDIAAVGNALNPTSLFHLKFVS